MCVFKGEITMQNNNKLIIAGLLGLGLAALIAVSNKKQENTQVTMQSGYTGGCGSCGRKNGFT